MAVMRLLVVVLECQRHENCILKGRRLLTYALVSLQMLSPVELTLAKVALEPSRRGIYVLSRS